MAIRALVWGENVHEQTNEVVRSIYPDGMHATTRASRLTPQRCSSRSTG